MNPMFILPLALSAYSIYQQHQKADKDQKYQEDQDAYKKTLQEKAEKERRMAALERVLKSRVSVMGPPKPYEPEAPDTTGERTRAGIADLLAGYGTHYLMGDYNKYNG